MAVFSKRALTLATLGVLTAYPLSSASLGIIERPDDPIRVVDGGGVSARAFPGGPLTFSYSNEERIRSAIRLEFGVSSKKSHYQTALNTYQYDGLLLLKVKVQAQAYQHITHASVLPYAIDIDVADRQTELDPARSVIFSYGLDATIDTRLVPVTTALTKFELAYQVDVKGIIRKIDAGNVYLNRHLTNFVIDLSSKTTRTKKVYGRFSFNVKGSCSYWFTVGNNDEELIMLMARYILNDA